MGEQETGSRYFSVETRKNDDHDHDHDEGGEEDEEASRGGRNKKLNEDFAATQLTDRLRYSSWHFLVDGESAEELGVEKCGECKLYHE